MRHRQRGITFIGFLVLAVLIGVVAYGGLRLVPVYLEHMAVSSVMKSVKSELDGQGASPVTIRNAIERRLNVESVSTVNARDFDISRGSGGWVLRIEYEGRVPYLGNLSLVASFDRQVEIRR